LKESLFAGLRARPPHCKPIRVAETKAKEATELGRANGYPLFFTTEPEE